MPTARELAGQERTPSPAVPILLRCCSSLRGTHSQGCQCASVPCVAGAKPPLPDPLLPQHILGCPKRSSPSPAPAALLGALDSALLGSSLGYCHPPAPAMASHPLGDSGAAGTRTGTVMLQARRHHWELALFQVTSPLLCRSCSASSQVAFVPPTRISPRPSRDAQQAQSGIPGGSEEGASAALPPWPGIHPHYIGKHFSFSFCHRSSETLTPAHLLLPSRLHI